MKDSGFFFFFGQRAAVNGERRRSTVNGGGDVTRADVANRKETRVRRVMRVGARARVAREPETSGGAWGRVRAWLESQKLLAARGATCGA